LLRELLKLENVQLIDIAMSRGTLILKSPGQCCAEDIPFPIARVNYSQMIHSKSQQEAQIESFALLGRLLICEDMKFQTKPTLHPHSCTEMEMVHGKPVNRSTSSTNHFHCW
jgi:hypothetical protein